MKTYLIPVTNSYEYDYCNYVIVKSETASDAYHAALNISEVKDYDRLVDDDLSHYKIFDGNLNSPKEFFYESEKRWYDIFIISSMPNYNPKQRGYYVGLSIWFSLYERL